MAFEESRCLDRQFILQISGALVYQPADLRQQPCLNDEIVEWCYANCKGTWDFRFQWFAGMLFAIEFEDELDKLHFMMRWFNG